jgi:hypothetical protein
VSILGDIAGGVAGLFSDSGSDEAREYYKQLAAKYAALNPNITAETYGADAPTRAAQLEVLGELKNQYSRGGLDAIAKSQIAGAETETNRNALALANAIGSRARAGGNANSGVTLALEQAAGQDAAERTRQTGMDAAGMGLARQQAALGMTGQLATAAGGQQNAIDRYNAMARQTAAQQTYANKLAQLGGEGEAYGGAYGAQREGYKNKVGAWGRLGSGIGEGAGSLAGYLNAA